MRYVQGLIQPNLDSDISLLGTPILGAQITVDTRKEKILLKERVLTVIVFLYFQHIEERLHIKYLSLNPKTTINLLKVIIDHVLKI